MAILKAIATPVGIDAGYWRIGIRHYDDVGKSMWVHVVGYPSKEAAAKATEPVHRLEAHLDYETYKDASRAELYAAIKTGGPTEPKEEDIPPVEQVEGGPTKRQVQVPVFKDAMDDGPAPDPVVVPAGGGKAARSK